MVVQVCLSHLSLGLRAWLHGLIGDVDRTMHVLQLVWGQLGALLRNGVSSEHDTVAEGHQPPAWEAVFDQNSKDALQVYTALSTFSLGEVAAGCNPSKLDPSSPSLFACIDGW